MYLLSNQWKLSLWNRWWRNRRTSGEQWRERNLSWGWRQREVRVCECVSKLSLCKRTASELCFAFNNNNKNFDFTRKYKACLNFEKWATVSNIHFLNKTKNIFSILNLNVPYTKLSYKKGAQCLPKLLELSTCSTVAWYHAPLSLN